MSLKWRPCASLELHLITGKTMLHSNVQNMSICVRSYCFTQVPHATLVALKVTQRRWLLLLLVRSLVNPVNVFSLVNIALLAQ